ncbi:MAG: endonuclease V [Thalassobius sp.]|nr:endonuclease V [Thalassovita sp.]
MIALFDVDYREDKAHAAAVIIENWQSEDPFRIYTKIIDNIEAYQPGEFYKRELPCLVSLISLFEEKISVLVVDSYVWVKSKKGLGGYLYDHFQGKYPVVGVAKSRFADNDENCVELLRGESNNPLFISAIGTDLIDAKDNVAKMTGEFRMPAMLKLVDRLSKEWDR